MPESYPLSWPDNWKRTPLKHRRDNWSWKGGTQKYRYHLLDELRKLGVDRVIISTNKPLRNDGHFRADVKEPDDAGVAIYFKYNGSYMCFACDKYTRTEWNLHSIGLTVESIRTIERCGASDMMERAFKGFTQLAEHASEAWRDTLGFSADQKVSPDDVESSFRLLVHKHHPDKGGDAELFHRLVLARENARRDLGVER